jgi:hypothetical protein
LWVKKPTICGVGPVAGNAHTAQYLDLDSIVPRAQTLAIAILRTGWIEWSGRARIGRKEFKIKHLL